MKSPANRSEVVVASDTEPVITGEVLQEEEPRSIKVFFTAPGNNLEFYHLSPNTTGWDVVTRKRLLCSSGYDQPAYSALVNND